MNPQRVPCTPVRLCFSASSLASCRRLFRFLGQFRSGAWAVLHVHSTVPTPGRRAFMHPSPFAKHDRSTALRSGRFVLFRPSSLQGRSDFPYARNAPLAGVAQLEAPLPPVETDGNAGISGPLSRYLSPHAAVLTPGPRSVQMPFASRTAMAFPLNVEGRRVARTTRFIPHTDSPSYLRLHSPYEAATFVFLLRPAVLASTPDWVEPSCMARQLFAVPRRGKFRPRVTPQTRPQPTYPKGLLV